jgi:hypothetical protein
MDKRKSSKKFESFLDLFLGKFLDKMFSGKGIQEAKIIECLELDYRWYRISVFDSRKI